VRAGLETRGGIICELLAAEGVAMLDWNRSRSKNARR
jgi:hypothetical protein